VWQLTGGRRHVTDLSNASRTMLFDIHRQCWDDDLLALFDIPRAVLPEVVASSGVLGETDPALFGAPIPIGGLAGDQQAATFGQACLSPGMAKNTYGTGCFLMLNTGQQPVESTQRLLTTPGWRIGARTDYLLEGSVFIGGAVVQWLRDGLGSSSGRPTSKPSPPRCPTAAARCWCPPSPASARPGGTATPAAPWSA
jgi:glycerol kinase